MASAMASMYVRCSCPNTSSTFNFADPRGSPGSSSVSLSSIIPCPSYHGDAVFHRDGGGKHIDRTGPAGLMVQRRVGPVGEYQGQGIGMGDAHLPDQYHPVPVGQQGIDDRDVDSVEVHVAGSGDRTRLPDYFEVGLLGEPSGEGFPERIVRGYQQDALRAHSYHPVMPIRRAACATLRETLCRHKASSSDGPMPIPFPAFRLTYETHVTRPLNRLHAPPKEL